MRALAWDYSTNHTVWDEHPDITIGHIETSRRTAGGMTSDAGRMLFRDYIAQVGVLKPGRAGIGTLFNR